MLSCAFWRIQYARLDLPMHDLSGMQNGHSTSDSNRATDGEAQASGWPAYIPWVHGSSRHEQRFVCDVMLEGLARQMRLFGLDALSMEQRSKRQRSAVMRCAFAIQSMHAHRPAPQNWLRLHTVLAR